MAVKGSIQSDLNKEIENMLSNKKLRHFVRWYCDGADKKDYERIKAYYNDMDIEKALNLYLEKEDVQKAILYCTKFQKDLNLCKIYQQMVKKALGGDVSSANWVVNFSDSDFFGTKKNEINDILEGLNMVE